MLLERLRNEVTRLPAVRALATICTSPCAAADLTPVLEPAAQELTGFLRKANRMLKPAALDALEVSGGSWGGTGEERRTGKIDAQAMAQMTVISMCLGLGIWISENLIANIAPTCRGSLAILARIS